MKEDIEYLEKTLSFKTRLDYYKNYFFWIYPFTNENIKECFNLTDMKNKSILTVTSSGDHALNAILNGATRVDSFDKNRLAKYYQELKIAGIKTLDFNQFIDFFYNKPLKIKSKYFNIEMYKKYIRDMLDYEFKIFWDEFYLLNKRKQIKKCNLFTTDYLKLYELKRCNNYMNIDSFYKLRELLKSVKIDYYDKNITELNTNKKYDIISLSNILAYSDLDYKSNEILKLKEDILKHAKDNTFIYLCYLYSTLYLNDYKKYIYNEKKVKDTFKEFNIKYNNVKSSINLPLEYDQIITLKKKI